MTIVDSTQAYTGTIPYTCEYGPCWNYVQAPVSRARTGEIFSIVQEVIISKPAVSVTLSEIETYCVDTVFNELISATLYNKGGSVE